MSCTWPAENETNGIAERVHTRADLRAQAAARTPDRLIFASPFAPIGVFDQRIENTLPNALLGPSAETLEHAVPVAELFRQIAPGCAGASEPEHRIDEKAIVLAVPSFVSFFTCNKLLDAPPLRARKFSPNQDRPPQFRS